MRRALTLALAGAACLTVAPAVAQAARHRGPAPVATLSAVETRTAVRDASGARWTPDRFATGGSLVTSGRRVINTWAPGLYRSERVGVRSISIPLRKGGSYLVVLYFAEITRTRPGARVFSVLAQGRRVATVDIARDVGTFRPYHLPFTVWVPRRRLTVGFRAIRGRPVLSGVQVQPAPRGLQIPSSHLIWDDEFTGPAGTSPDPQRWTFDLGPGWNQAAAYTDSPANASLDGLGHLYIQARPTKSGYTSARMTTWGRFSVTYGIAEARIRVSAAPGVVSSFWGIGTNIPSVNWPRSGEIDPGEVRGSYSSVLVQALHMPCGSVDCPAVWDTNLPVSLAAAFHTFALERAPGVAVFMLDGRPTATLAAADVPRGSWVFDKPFYLILNMIVGGWAGNPAANANWPATMVVDWVRVFG